MKRRGFLITTALCALWGRAAMGAAPTSSARPIGRGSDSAELLLERPLGRGEERTAPKQPSLAEIIEDWAQGGTASVSLMDVQTGDGPIASL